AGLSLARDDVRSPLDAASDPVAPDDLALDLASRWSVRGGVITAQNERARADLPWLRFADVRVQIGLQGQGQLLLEPDSAAPAVIALRAGKLAIGDCGVVRDPKASCVIERRGGALVLQSGDHHVRCDAPELGARIGIAIVAEPGAALHSLSVTRL